MATIIPPTKANPTWQVYLATKTRCDAKIELHMTKAQAEKLKLNENTDSLGEAVLSALTRRGIG